MFFNPITKLDQYGFEYGDDLRNLSRSDLYYSAMIKQFIDKNSHLPPGQLFALATALVLNVIAKIEAFLEKNPHANSFCELKGIKVDVLHGTIISFENLVEGFAGEAISAVQMQRKRQEKEDNLGMQFGM